MCNKRTYLREFAHALNTRTGRGVQNPQSPPRSAEDRVLGFFAGYGLNLRNLCGADCGFSLLKNAGPRTGEKKNHVPYNFIL
jgi:hypothetical protein